MWRLLNNDFEVKGADRSDPEVKVFFDKTNIVKVEEDWFAKMTPDGIFGPLLLMDACQLSEFEDAIERGPCALPVRLQRYYWKGLKPTPTE